MLKTTAKQSTKKKKKKKERNKQTKKETNNLPEYFLLRSLSTMLSSLPPLPITLINFVGMQENAIFRGPKVKDGARERVEFHQSAESKRQRT